MAKDDQPKDRRVAKDQPEPKPADQPAKEAQPDETAELRAQVLRIRADFDNYRKRVEEERARYISVARTDVVLSLLPVIDNFDRAFADVPQEVAQTNWYQGIAAIKQQFEGVLRELQIERIESVGQPFDPALHEAIAHEPSDEHAKDVVASEFEAGYRLGDAVIRHARVKVSSGKAADSPDEPEPTNHESEPEKENQ